MYHLRRALISRLGHSSAEYRGNIIPFHEIATGKPTQSLVVAVNGSGKTTALSLIFSVFEPAKGRFVQSLQRRDHRYEAYFWDSPGIVALEMERSEASFDPERIVIGYVHTKKRVAANHQPLFFSFRVTPGKTLDELPWPGTSADKEGIVRDWDDVMAWKADWQGRSYGDVGMQCFESQSGWKKHLKTDLGIPLDLITSQIDLARTEGGLSKMFETLKTDADVIGMLSDMMGLSDKANEKIEEVRESLKSLVSMPLIEKEIAVAEALLFDMEDVDAAAAAVGGAREGMAAVDRDRMTAAGHLTWERNVQTDLANRLAARAEDANREAADADGRAAFRTAEAEAWRVVSAKGRVTEAQATADAHDQERAGIDESIAALTLAGPYKDLRDAENRFATNLGVLEEAKAGNADKLRPAYEAGTALAGALAGAAALESASEKEAKASQQEAEERKGAQEGIAKEADIAIGKAESRKGDRLDAEKRIASFREEIASAGFDVRTLAEDLSDAEVRLRSTEEELNTAKGAIHHAEARGRAAADRSKRADKDLGAARKAHEDRTKVLKGREDAIERFRSDRDTVAVFEADDVDALDPGTALRLKGIGQNLSASVKVIEQDLRDKGGLLEAYNRGFTRQDDDIEKAFRQIADLGITVHYAPDYISKTVKDGEKAGVIVEADPARMFHGLMVDSRKDLERIEQVFDKSTWKLAAPLVVSVISHDVAPSRGYDHVLLSAWSGAAYHEPTRQAEIAALATDIEKLKAGHGRLVERFEQVGKVETALRELLAAEANLPLSVLRSEVESLAGAVEESLAEVESSRQEVADADVALMEARETETTRKEAHSSARHRVSVLSSYAARHQEVMRSLKGMETVEELDARIAILTGELESARMAVDGLVRAIAEHKRREDECWKRRREIEGELEDLKYVDRDHVVLSTVSSDELEALRASYRAREQVAEDDMQSLKLLEGAVEDARRAISEKQSEIRDTETALLGSVPADRADAVREAGREHSLMARPEIRSELAAMNARRIESERTGKKIAAEMAVLKAEAKFKRTDAMGSVDVEACLAGVEESRDAADPQACEDRRNESVRAADAARMSAAQSRAAGDKANAERRAAEDRVKAIRMALKTLGEGSDIQGVVASEGALPADEQGLDNLIEGIRSRLKTARGELKGATDKLQTQRSKLARAADKVIAEKVTRNAVSLAERLKSMADGGEWQSDIGTRERLENFVAGQRHDIKTLEPRKENVIRGLEHVLITSLSALKRAVKASIPKKAGRFGGLTVLRCSVPFTDIEAANYRMIVRPYFDKLLESYAHQGDGLRITGREMVVGLLRACLGVVGRDEWGFTLLSPVAQSSENNWQKINSITGSGGQVLTSAFLLYLVIAEVRSVDSGSVFLLLDNPLGVASAKALVQTQISVAEAMGIQIIAMTGIKEYDAMKCFTNVVQARLYKGTNRASVDVQQVGNEVWGSQYNLRFATEAA